MLCDLTTQPLTKLNILMVKKYLVKSKGDLVREWQVMNNTLKL